MESSCAEDAVKAQIVHRLFIKMLLFILRESGRILGSLREIDESIGEKKNESDSKNIRYAQ